MDRNPPDKLLRVTEVAERLGLRVSTIRAWVLYRRIEAVRVGRRAIRIPSSAVQKIIEAGMIPAREPRQ
jgi:excisionase family DNA binding protein